MHAYAFSDRERVLRDLPEHMRDLYRTGAYYVSVPPGLAPTYEEGYWGTVVDPDGNRRDRLVERRQHLDDVCAELAYMAMHGPCRFLDAGCGLGWVLSALDERWDKHGIELSRFAAEHASQYAPVRVASLEELPYGPASFDLVLCHHVIEHLVAPERGLAELRRVLRPGGKLILGTPDFDGGAARRWRENYRLTFDPTHVSLFGSDSMHRFLRDHGFRIERVERPYFQTRHFTRENLLRQLDADAVSPPFYGSFMTFYAERI